MNTLKARIKRIEQLFSTHVTVDEGERRFFEWCAMHWGDINHVPGEVPGEYRRDPESLEEMETLVFEHLKKIGQAGFTSLEGWKNFWIKQLSL